MFYIFSLLITFLIIAIMYLNYKKTNEKKIEDLANELSITNDAKMSLDIQYSKLLADFKKQEELRVGKSLDEIKLLFNKINIIDDKITFLDSNFNEKMLALTNLVNNNYIEDENSLEYNSDNEINEEEGNNEEENIEDEEEENAEEENGEDENIIDQDESNNMETEDTNEEKKEVEGDTEEGEDEENLQDTEDKEEEEEEDEEEEEEEEEEEDEEGEEEDTDDEDTDDEDTDDEDTDENIDSNDITTNGKIANNNNLEIAEENMNEDIEEDILNNINASSENERLNTVTNIANQNNDESTESSEMPLLDAGFLDDNDKEIAISNNISTNLKKTNSNVISDEQLQTFNNDLMPNIDILDADKTDDEKIMESKHLNARIDMTNDFELNSALKELNNISSKNKSNIPNIDINSDNLQAIAKTVDMQNFEEKVKEDIKNNKNILMDGSVENNSNMNDGFDIKDSIDKLKASLEDKKDE